MLHCCELAWEGYNAYILKLNKVFSVNIFCVELLHQVILKKQFLDLSGSQLWMDRLQVFLIL